MTDKTELAIQFIDNMLYNIDQGWPVTPEILIGVIKNIKVVLEK
jgi:hypothetical protein